MKLVNEDTLRELAGRMYECCDIQMAIESGRFASLAALMEFLEDQSGRLDRTIKAAHAGEPLVFNDCCVVLKD